MLTHDEHLKLRSKLHTLISLAEIAKSNLMTAEREYEQARDRVNEVIDRLAPLYEPEPRSIAASDRKAVNNSQKISLIKLVRCASVETGGSVMGLKEAKDMVERYIDTGNGQKQSPIGPTS